jgi:integrase
LDTASDRFYARAVFPPQKGYKVFSTKQVAVDAAIQSAKNRYYELAGRASLNITTKTESIVVLIDEYLNYKERISPFKHTRKEGYTTKYRQVYQRFIKPFFSKPERRVEDLHIIQQEDISAYWNYRLDYWKGRHQNPEYIKSKYGNKRTKFMNAHRLSETTPSHTTLNIEVQLFRSFFKWAVSRGYLTAQNIPDIINPVPKVEGKTAKLRGIFTTDEYREIKKDVMDRASNPADSKGRPSDLMTFRAERMYCYFFTASSFGCRPSELKHLRFNMVKLYEDEKTGKRFSVIELPAELAKANPDGTRRGRNIYSFDNELAYNRIHKRWKGVLRKLFGNQEIKDDDYLFPKWIPLNRRGFVEFQPAKMDVPFRVMLQRLGKHKDDKGRPRSPYALRKFYITQRIIHNTPLPALAINTGHDIQTLWNWYASIQTSDMREYLTRRDANQFNAELVEIRVEDNE